MSTEVKEICETLKQNYAKQQKLMNQLNELTVANKVKTTGNPQTTGVCTGFNQPEPIPESLHRLLKPDQDLASRFEVTLLLYRYINEHELYHADQKRIVPNRTMKKAFGMSDNDVLTYYNLQTWLRKLYQ